jgi:peptidoglycan/LPS O-acetylase OafA/YrhL
MQHPRIDEIDGLRAVAMTAVVAHHCGLAPFGWTGVWLFFVISGYVISRNFLAREYIAEDWRHEYRNFMVRRFFRIVPVYWLYILLAAAMLAFLGPAGVLRDLPFLLTFTFNWQMIFELWPDPGRWMGFLHLATLSIEEQFYLLFPLLFLLLPRRLYLPCLIALIAAGPLLRFVYAGALSGVSSDRWWLSLAVYTSSFAHFDAFLVGALIASLEPKICRDARVPLVLAGAALLTVGAFTLHYWQVERAAGASSIGALLAVFGIWQFGNGREIFVYSVVNLAAATVLVYAILQKPITRPLAWPIVSFVGRISYGAYLYHVVALWLVMQGMRRILAGGWPTHLRQLVLLAFVWPLTVALAYVSYRWFEKPITDWSRRLSSPRLQHSAEPLC